MEMKYEVGDVVKIAREELFMYGCKGEVIGIIEPTKEYIVGFFMITDEGDVELYDEFIYYENELEEDKDGD